MCPTCTARLVGGAHKQRVERKIGGRQRRRARGGDAALGRADWRASGARVDGSRLGAAEAPCSVRGARRRRARLVPKVCTRLWRRQPWVIFIGNHGMIITERTQTFLAGRCSSMYPTNLTSRGTPCMPLVHAQRPSPLSGLCRLGLLVLLGKTTASRTAYEKKWALVVNTFSHFRQNPS